MASRLAMLTLVVALAPWRAFAQGGDEAETAVARTLFEEGRAAAEAEDWALASERFRQTVALRDTPAVRYNLGVSLIHLGQLLAGLDNLEQATSEAAFAEAARELIAATRPRLARLAIDVPPGDWDVVVDGRPLSDALVGSDVPTDPGRHFLELLGADGETRGRQEVVLDEGGALRVYLSESEVPVATGATPPFDSTPGITTAITGGAALAVGVALTITAAWSWTDTETAVREYDAFPSVAGFHDANGRATRTELLGGFGAGALALGCVLLPLGALLLGHADAEPEGVALLLGPGDLGLAARAGW